ncbi:hypothetical protein GWI33_013380 [Rhynchophorus ferrugineus]|uniref:Uncharacterized protein n=1 Tax=Rhynchophorus ferrugineus TaxID=354439 RepID=A0A834I8C7_RHYFE|nr:hypothetical protein GWI33_013380 [Rhynchophorus ferrugineus]
MWLFLSPVEQWHNKAGFLRWSVKGLCDSDEMYAKIHKSATVSEERHDDIDIYEPGTGYYNLTPRNGELAGRGSLDEDGFERQGFCSESLVVHLWQAKNVFKRKKKTRAKRKPV